MLTGDPCFDNMNSSRKQELTIRVFLVVLTLTLLFVTVFSHSTFGADPTPSADCSASLNWLRSQIVPNKRVSTPHPQRRGLILSYAPSQGQKGPLDNKSFVYDAALGAIALSQIGRASCRERV